MELILEIGPADGNLGYALSAVHAAKDAGADWVKGQIYDRSKLVTQTARTYHHGLTGVPSTQYEDFQSQLSYTEWAKVKTECDRIDLGFFASVFDTEAVRFCEDQGVTRYKIASGDITYKQLIQRVAATGKHVILSTGASRVDEIVRAMTWVTDHHSNLTLLACNLAYPTPPEEANLQRIRTLRTVWPHVGYSDHTPGTGAIVRAAHLGAEVVEKHFTITPRAGGDHDFAVTVKQLLAMFAEEDTVGDPIYDGSGKLEPTLLEMKASTGARRSVWAKRDLPQGSILDWSDVEFLRPGGGLEPWQLDAFVGRPLRVDVPRMQALREDMF